MSAIPQRLLGEALLISAKKNPSKIAVIVKDVSYSYQELKEGAEKLASSLQNSGIKKGDRVAIYMSNSWESILSIYGAALSGAVFLFINPQTKANKLQYILNDCGAKILIAENALSIDVSQALEDTKSVVQVIISGNADKIFVQPHFKLTDFDGIVWYRKTISINAADAGKPAVLELAMIDDADETYINGVKVGSTNSYNEKRKYNIPAGILKEGKNIIVARVLDTGGGGGIWGDAADMKITVAVDVIPLQGEWKYQVAIASSTAVAVGPNSYPTLLSNGMISPLVPFAIKGAIWYQGEANAGRAYQYRKALPLMITDWRKRWGLGDFPFYFVQLASFNANNGNSQKGSEWAELREAQAMTLSLPNTGMSVTTDIGEVNDIHPKNKQDVGKRLAAIALNKNYGKVIEYSGPVYESMKIEHDKIVLTFTHTGSGLMTKNKYGYLQGFEISGADKKFYYAKAFIKDNTVIVFADEVTSPAAVRFGWADDAGENNLFNKEGFPAVPFRTDSWQGVTDKVQYKIGN